MHHEFHHEGSSSPSLHAPSGMTLIDAEHAWGLTKLQRGDEPGAGERIECALVHDVEDNVEGVPESVSRCHLQIFTGWHNALIQTRF